ncbi:MAG: hypothetical protein E6J90_13305 [Deltaproteobacteria bacterium]|nr:MAG: hypothetical protein E6J91_39250 [Deltaproteobacteria bacterium]TMQ21943.1 MAG: hypothetical protein E6J90_13305 [Deltaproteobacteria bacterium]
MSIQESFQGILFGIALVTGLLGTSVAMASPMINIPGSACIAEGGVPLNVDTDGEAENLSTSVVWAICAAERTISPSDTTLGGTVWVIDLSSTQDVCCRAVSKNPGGARVNGPFTCSSGATSTFQGLTITSITDPFTFSSFYFECQLPANSGGGVSRIQGYRTVAQ